MKLLLAAWFAIAPITKLPDRVFMLSDVDYVVRLDTLEGRCSATVIEKDLVATAAHCVEAKGLAMVEVDPSQGEAGWEVFEVVYKGLPGSRKDVALLKGNTRDIKPAKIAQSLDGPTACYAFGFAGTEVEMMMPCFLLEDGGQDGILGLGQVRPGDSGGGVFGRNGEMIAVIWGSDMVYQMVVAPIQELQAALKAYRNIR